MQTQCPQVLEQRSGFEIFEIKMATFGGANNEDIDSSTIKFNGIARIQNWEDNKSTNILPLYLQKLAEAWFTTTTEIQSKKICSIKTLKT